MFTTIMYGVINEITRQPATSSIPLRGRARSERRPVARQRPTARPARNAAGHQARFPGRFQILADSFKRAAGYY